MKMSPAQSVTHERARDCRVPKADTPTYHVKVDGEWTIQNRMFSRADMAFWEFGAADVAPPTGSTLEFWSTGEPHFEPRKASKRPTRR
jgi:hypothetical protein